uniref:Uncharacterized protein n=1 Tax=Rhizophora mucronata TaxID=61149 RepID=A0A2P2QRW2_RHIMU
MGMGVYSIFVFGGCLCKAKRRGKKMERKMGVHEDNVCVFYYHFKPFFYPKKESILFFLGNMTWDYPT